MSRYPPCHDPELAALTLTERVILALALEPNSTARDLSVDTGFQVGTICAVLKPLEMAGQAAFEIRRGRHVTMGRPARCWRLVNADALIDRYSLTFYFERMGA